jgi:hypothetical protein
MHDLQEVRINLHLALGLLGILERKGGKPYNYLRFTQVSYSASVCDVALRAAGERQELRRTVSAQRPYD